MNSRVSVPNGESNATHQTKEEAALAYYADDIVTWSDPKGRVIRFGMVQPYYGIRPVFVKDWPPVTESIEQSLGLADKTSENDDTQEKVFQAVKSIIDSSIQASNVQDGACDVRMDESFEYEVAASIPQKGKVLVHFALSDTDAEYLVQTNSLQLTDRESLFVGDEVRHISTGRCGRIQAKHRRVSGWLPNYNIFLHDVLVDFNNRCRLQPVLFFNDGYQGKDVVFYESWLGVVYDFKYDVVVQFYDGARCLVPESIIFNLMNSDRMCYESGDIYEGQLICGDARSLKSKRGVKFLTETALFNAGWLLRLKCELEVELVVEKMILRELRVNWLTSRYSEFNPPPAILRGNILEKLAVCRSSWDCLFNCMCYLRLTAGDVMYILDNKHSTSQDEGSDNCLSEQQLQSIFFALHTNDEKWIEENMRKITWPDNVMSSEPTETVMTSTTTTVATSGQTIINDVPSCSTKANQNTRKVLLHRSRCGFPRTHTDCTTCPSEKKKKESLSNVANAKKAQKPTSLVTFPLELRLQWLLERIRHCQDFSTYVPSSKVVQSTKGLLPINVVTSKATITVVWQDGEETEVPIGECEPILNSIDEHQFYPGDMVVRKNDFRPEGGKAEPTYGIILNVNAEERTCSVQWFANARDVIDKPDESLSNSEVVKYGEPEHCVVYELLPHSLHLRLPTLCVLEEDQNTEPLKLFAQVANCTSSTGKLQVTFANGEQGSIFPSKVIASLEEFMDSFDEVDSTSEDSFSSVSWETDEEEELFELDESTTKFQQAALTNLIAALEEIKMTLSKLDTDMGMSELDSLCTRVNSPSASTTTFYVAGRKLLEPYMKHINEIRTHLTKAYQDHMDVRIKTLLDDLKVSNLCALITSCISKEPLTIDISSNSDNSADLGTSKMNEISSNAVTITQTILKSYNQLLKEILTGAQEGLLVCIADLEVNGIGLLPTGDNENVTKDSGTSSLPSDVQPSGSSQSLNDTEKIIKENELVEEVKDVSSDIRCDSNNTAHEAQMNEREDESSSSCTAINTPTMIAGGKVGDFKMLEDEPLFHKFHDTKFQHPSMQFSRAVHRDHQLLSTSLPPGVWVRAYETRLDLFSVMIAGPAETPYEYCLFFFDFRLTANYPIEPPDVHYYSFSDERINPNLYVEGKVCLSLLGTWHGKGSENWNPKTSNLLQLIISIQGLILVPDPWYNEAGFDACRQTNEGTEQSRLYNETILIMLTHGTRKLLNNLVAIFLCEIQQFYQQHSSAYLEKLECWLRVCEAIPNTPNSLSSVELTEDLKKLAPKFPLVPVSRGFVVAMKKAIDSLRKCLQIHAYLVLPNSGE